MLGATKLFRKGSRPPGQNKDALWLWSPRLRLPVQRPCQLESLWRLSLHHGPGSRTPSCFSKQSLQPGGCNAHPSRSPSSCPHWAPGLQLPGEGDPEPRGPGPGGPYCRFPLLDAVLAPAATVHAAHGPSRPFQTVICSIKPGSLSCLETVMSSSGEKKMPGRGCWDLGQSQGGAARVCDVPGSFCFRGNCSLFWGAAAGL